MTKRYSGNFVFLMAFQKAGFAGPRFGVFKAGDLPPQYPEERLERVCRQMENS